jgi:hypothetical protein
MVVLCALTLILFSTLFSLAAWYDWWPRLPPGALHDTDLWAGLAAGVALLLLLLRHPSEQVESQVSGVESSDGTATGDSAPER